MVICQSPKERTKMYVFLAFCTALHSRARRCATVRVDPQTTRNQGVKLQIPSRKILPLKASSMHGDYSPVMPSSSSPSAGSCVIIVERRREYHAHSILAQLHEEVENHPEKTDHTSPRLLDGAVLSYESVRN